MRGNLMEFNIKRLTDEEAAENVFFRAVLDEEAPMYDAAIVSENGILEWKNPNCNSINNSHSATKFFIAAAVGRLRDEGKLDLDAPVTSFFSPELLPSDMEPRWHNVTVRNTLRHMTGMGDDSIRYGVDEDDSNTMIGDDFLSEVFRTPLPHAPETCRRYSDAAYYLLSRIVAAAGGMTADKYLNESFFKPLGFGQWTMVCCPQGHPIGGGGLFARARDIAKMGYLYAIGGVWDGKRLISEEWIGESKENDFALGRFRDFDVWVKTGARGQMIAFSQSKKTAVAWHGCAFPDDNGKRNDRLLEAFVAYCKF